MFEYLKKYVVDKEFEGSENKHVFYKVGKEDIKKAEEKMLVEFPKELVAFYEEIGYGFFYDEDECFIDVLMKPQDVTDFRCGNGDYFYSEEREVLLPEDMVFFEVDSNCHIYIKMSGENKGKIYLGHKEIAENFESFVMNLNEKSNYFFRL